MKEQREFVIYYSGPEIEEKYHLGAVLSMIADVIEKQAKTQSRGFNELKVKLTISAKL